MLNSVNLKFSGSEELNLPTTGITIFVGPNNSGKSLVLKEIEQAFTVYPFPSGLKILQDYDVNWLTDDEITSLLSKHEGSQPSGVAEGHIVVGRINPNGGREGTNIHKATVLAQNSQKNDKRWWATQFLRWGLIRLDGRSRFNLTNDQSGGDLLAPPQNVLAHLFKDEEARKRVRELVYDAFGLYFSIDPTNLGQLRIRMSQNAPLSDEQSLNESAREYYKNATYIKDASDGVQAYTGIVTAVLSGEFNTILVDEPEAFLHPPLARKLGKHLATLATERGAALLASTHSSDFLMGCVQATKDVRVVRMEYSGGKSKGKVVDPEQLERLFKRPLMRSANVISALFYDGVVVTESDNDRAFYSEIYYRLSSKEKDYPSILFVNAQNKQTIIDIIGPLRGFGVPAVAISDIDIIKDGGKTWTDWLESARISPALRDTYNIHRSTIKSLLEASGKNMKTDGGVDILSDSHKDAANELFDKMAEYGIFAVRRGELESWLPDLQIPGKKTDWTIAMLERLGSDPANRTYVHPSEGDVWSFMRTIVAWIRNPNRKGM